MRRVRRGLGLLVLLVIAVAVAWQAAEGPAPADKPASSGQGRTPPTGEGRTPPPTHQPAARPPALRALERLPVKGRAPMTGYDRALFGQAWSDDNDQPWGHNGCDTRNDILRRDLIDVTLKSGTHGCLVLTGTLADPYTGRRIPFTRGVGTSTAVEIDHVVALADAWQTGAQRWSDERRQEFANDPLELLAVDGPTNMSKGAGDAATWLPPNKAFRCTYVARQIAVKAKYHLWMTAAEKAATQRILNACPNQVIPGTTVASQRADPR